MHAQKWHRGVGNGVNQVVNNLVMLRRKAEILTTERADDKARFEAEHFHQPVSHQPGTANQRRCFIFTALTGAYHHAVFMLTEGADFGVINNLAASGLEDFCHCRCDFAVADNAAGRHKNATKPGDIRFALAQFHGVYPLALDTVRRCAFP
ncbi:Uncharacterised protein [Shigella sonnei]|nr:Uncharacterised protein [Shigella sonnei]CSQ80833.1 Uncharacterised protein [Shigella sonnei]